MHPVVVNGLIALTGIASAVAAVYVPDAEVKTALGGYAVFVLGYAIRRFGDAPYQHEIEKDAP